LIAHGSNVEKVFTVHPGGRVEDIRLSLEGASSLSVTAGGELAVDTGSMTVNFSMPVAYQDIAGERRSVQVAYALRGNTYGFQTGKYNRKFDLVIDPALVYSKILGGFADEYGYGIAVDSAGNAYVAGYTRSDDFPTQNPYDGILDGYWDAFVSKFNASGTLVYSTYLGGNGYDKAFGIALDDSGNVYITGETASDDFPTLNAFDDTLGGFTDAFVTKLNAAGSALLWSTYLGGSDNKFGDYGVDIALDGAGSVYVTGHTDSTDFPVRNANQPDYGGGSWDGFVTRLTAAGNALAWSTYLGGSGNWDWGNAIAVDNAGNAYVTGHTNSDDFPVKNALQAGNAGGAFDAFVSKLAASGSLTWSTYLGGTDLDSGNGIAVDSAGNAYVTGETSSDDFPVKNAVQPDYGGGESGGDGFVTRLNAAGNALVWSTYLGGSEKDIGHSIALDTSGNVYVTGETASNDFPTQDPYQGTRGEGFAGIADVFVTSINASGNALSWSTYLGKSYHDIGHAIAVDESGYIYVTGETGLEFPADNIAPVKVNAFVSKFTPVAVPGIKAMPWLPLLLDE
jgi:hypothetical protein